MLKSAFISRAQLPDAPFTTILGQRGWQVEGKSLLELTPLPVPPQLPEADWIFFSSRQAVLFFFKMYPHISPGQYSWAAIGPGTAESLLSFAIQPDFTGSGEPLATAEAFGNRAAKSRVLFPEALHSRQSVRTLLQEKIFSISLPVYKNSPVANPPFQPQTILAFTSPMNASTYFSHHILAPHQYTIAIGQPTATALYTAGVARITLSPRPSEADLAETALQIIHSC